VKTFAQTLVTRSPDYRAVITSALIAASVAFGAPLRADVSESFRIYQENWQKAQEAYAAKDYETAAKHYQKVCEVLPFEPTSRFQLACCHARLGAQDKALAELQSAVRFGYEDIQKLEQSEDLKPLRTQSQFAQLLKDAVACRDETLIIHAGKRVDRQKPAPLLIVLQGLGCLRAEVAYWESVADNLGFVLVAPRAVTKAGPTMYGWHRSGARDSTASDYFDLAAAGKRVDEAIAEAKKRFAIDPDRVLLAGFSQGAGVALRLIGDHPERYRGAVAVCGLHQPPGVAYWESILKQHPIRVCVIAGKFDRLLPRSQKVVEQLRAAGVPNRYEELDKMGHEFPADYPKRLREAIEFVMQTSR
jgi:predicted esterase